MWRYFKYDVLTCGLLRGYYDKENVGVFLSLSFINKKQTVTGQFT